MGLAGEETAVRADTLNSNLSPGGKKPDFVRGQPNPYGLRPLVETPPQLGGKWQVPVKNTTGYTSDPSPLSLLEDKGIQLQEKKGKKASPEE